MAETATRQVVERSIAAQGLWSDELVMQQLERCSISVFGTAFTGTVTVQRKIDGVNWRDVKQYPGVDAEESYDADERCSLRIGVKSGDFAGTSVAVRLGSG